MSINYSYKVLITWICVSFFTFVQIVESSNSSEITDFERDEYARNCTLIPENEKKRLKLNKLIDEDNRLVKLSITVKWDQYQPDETLPTDKLWFLTTDIAGQRLLLLDDDYTVMSLGTLSYGIAAMQLTFKQNPENCVQNMTADEADTLLKYTILTLPSTSESVNDDGISTLHICTGSVNADGSCCNLTLTGEQVRCSLLAKDDWFSYISYIISIMAFIGFMRIVYLIPKSVYTDTNDNPYILGNGSGGQEFRIKLKMEIVSAREHGDESNLKEEWTKVNSQDVSDKPLQQFRHKIENGIDKLKRNIIQETERNKIQDFDRNTTQDRVIFYNFLVELESVKMEDHELVSEYRHSPSLPQSLFKTFSDVFLKCKIRNAYFLKSIFSKPFFGNLRRSVCFNKISKLFIAVIFLLPVIFRIIFICKYKHNFTSELTITIIFIVIYLASALVVILHFHKHKEGILNETKNILVESLQKLNEIDTESKMKKFTLITLFPLMFKCYIIGLFFVPFCFIAGIIVLIFYSLPLLRLSFSITSCINQRRKNMETHNFKKRFSFFVLTFILSYVFIIVTVSILMTLVAFYTECFIYISIGLLLNFDNVSNIVLLILIVITYAFDCLSRAYKKLYHFNNKVVKVLYRLIDSCKTNDEENISKNVQAKNKNAKVKLLSQTDDRFITLLADGEGKPCLSTTGLLIYYKFQTPENLQFMHVSERFLDELGANCGQLSPGQKYMILVGAYKEISCLLIVLSVVFLVISGLGRINDISDGINVFVTIGSSSALAMINKLLFKTDEFSLYDHDSHLTSLVERQAKRFRDLWADVNMKVTDCVHSVIPQSSEEIDIIFEISHKEKEGALEWTESWYVRPFFQNEQNESKGDVFYEYVIRFLERVKNAIKNCTCCRNTQYERL